MNNLADLSQESVEHYTPEEIINDARELMGGIDLDVASSTLANQRVRANRIYVEADNPLMIPIWKAKSVFLNPPSKSISDINLIRHFGTKSLATAFWQKLVKEYNRGYVKQAIYILVSTKLIGLSPNMLDFPLILTTAAATADCVTATGRIKFINPDGTEQRSPTQTNGIIYLPPVADEPIYPMIAFKERFSRYGTFINNINVFA